MTHKTILPQISGIILEDLTGLSLSELGQACAVHIDCIVDLVNEGVISPLGRAPHGWRFTGSHLRRATVAIRLQRDLGVNLAGAALAMQLLDEIKVLQVQLNISGNN